MPDARQTMVSAAKMYGVELYYRRVPETSRGELLSALQCRCPDLALASPERQGPPWLFEHRGHRVPSHGRPARAVVGLSLQPPNLQALESALAQSWAWPQSAEVLPKCGGSILLGDVAVDGLGHLERLVLFENLLLAMLDAYPCLAIHWQPTQQVVEPARFLAASKEAGGLVFVPGPLNVRLFRVTDEAAAAGGGAGDVVMDTLGLAALGLPDLQCHFTGLDPEDVSRVLYNTGIYILEHGDTIRADHTVPGPGPQEKWLCRRENSLALPDRPVIDLDPGPLHSARERRA
jgi:hypothetical protein